MTCETIMVDLHLQGRGRSDASVRVAKCRSLKRGRLFWQTGQTPWLCDAPMSSIVHRQSLCAQSCNVQFKAHHLQR